MKKSLTAFLAISALGLAACGGVDRDGTRDLFVKEIENAGFTADADCVDKVLDEYSDDELEKFDKIENQTSEEFEAFRTELLDCVDLDGEGG